MFLSAILDRSGAFGFRGDDWHRFDRQTVTVRHVIDGESFETDQHVVVKLLGVATPAEEPLHAQASDHLRSVLDGKTVTLKLDVPQTRDDAGRLAAYVYLSPTDCVNVDVIRDGFGYADRRVVHTLHAMTEAPEAAARKGGRGMWAEKNNPVTSVK